jgi:hypothetical protein
MLREILAPYIGQRRLIYLEHYSEYVRFSKTQNGGMIYCIAVAESPLPWETHDIRILFKGNMKEFLTNYI